MLVAAIVVENVAIRGYMNLLFGKEIYEWVNMDILAEIAADREKPYADLINVEDGAAWNDL